MQLRGVLFDLDDTLIDHRGAVARALHAWLPDLPADGLTLWNEASERHLVAWRERRISFAEQRHRRLRDFLPAVGIAFRDADLDEIFEGYLREYEAAWVVFPDVAETLTALANDGLVTAVLTNGTVEQQHHKLEKVGLAGRVGPVFTVEDLGVAKPDPAAFRLACARWGLDPATVLSVGDRHDLDVLPARRAGLRAVHLDRHDEGPHDEPHRITTLRHLSTRPGLHHGRVAHEDTLAKMQEAAALWSAGQTTAAEVVDVACHLLVAGFDGLNLAVLAGVQARHADAEVPDLLAAALGDVRLTHYPRDSQAGLEATVRILASRVLIGSLSPRSLAEWAHTTIGHDRLALAENLVDLDDVYDTVEYTGRTTQDVDDEVRAEARRITGNRVSP